MIRYSEVHFVDVGQGAAQVILMPNKYAKMKADIIWR